MVVGNQRAGAEEVPCGRDVVAGLIPVVGQPQQREVAGIERHEHDWKNHPERKGRVQPGLDQSSQGRASSSVSILDHAECLVWLVDGALREIVGLRFERERAEGLLVLGDVLPQHVPQGLGLLRTQVDGLVIADGHLVGALAGGETEDELEIPNADADLDAVGVGLAVIGRLG